MNKARQGPNTNRSVIPPPNAKPRHRALVSDVPYPSNPAFFYHKGNLKPKLQHQNSLKTSRGI